MRTTTASTLAQDLQPYGPTVLEMFAKSQEVGLSFDAEAES